jgi:hypothetical protein
VIAGVIVFGITALIYAIPRVRRLESELPDYTPEPSAETAPANEFVPAAAD